MKIMTNSKQKKQCHKNINLISKGWMASQYSDVIHLQSKIKWRNSTNWKCFEYFVCRPFFFLFWWLVAIVLALILLIFSCFCKNFLPVLGYYFLQIIHAGKFGFLTVNLAGAIIFFFFLNRVNVWWLLRALLWMLCGNHCLHRMTVISQWFHLCGMPTIKVW